MKIKLIREMSIDERNERLFYTPLSREKDELRRRQFLKYLVVGSAGLLVPIGVQKEAEAAAWLPLIPVAILGLKLYDMYRDSQLAKNPHIPIADADNLSCNIELINGGHKTAKGAIECGLHHQVEADMKYELVSNEQQNASVKAGWTKQYEIELGDASGEKGKYLFTGKTQKNKKKITYSVT